MDIKSEIKAFSDLIPSDLKLKFKELAAKLNGVPEPVPAPAPTPAPAAQFGEGVLEDGKTVIKYNTPALAEGSVVTVVTPEGELPAPEGEHKLQDGTVITVSLKDGNAVVTAVKPATPAVDPAMAAPAPQLANVLSQVSGFAEQMKTFASEKKELTEKFEAQDKFIKEQSEQIKELKGIVKDFVDVFSSIADIPSDDPVNKPANKSTKKNKLLTLAD